MRDNNTLKTVRFSHGADHVIQVSNEAPTENTNNITWWTPAELETFQESAKRSSYDCSEKPWMTKSFERAYKRSQRIADIFEQEAILHSKICQVKAPLELTDWCRFGHLKRGLERWSSTSHNAVRSDNISRARKLITEMNACDDVQLIRQISERCSRTSRVFARIMGQADADAIGPHPPLACWGISSDIKSADYPQYRGIASKPCFRAPISSRSA